MGHNGAEAFLRQKRRTVFRKASLRCRMRTISCSQTLSGEALLGSAKPERRDSVIDLQEERHGIYSK